MEDRANILREMKICRFCLSNNETDLTNIHDKFKDDSVNSVPLPLQIMSCIAIEVFKNDGMPQLICSSCRKLTMQCYIFKSNCRKADEALKLFVATGQLSKPYMQKVEQIKVVPKKPRNIKLLQKQAPSPTPLTLHTKTANRIKMEDGTEIITFNIENFGSNSQPIVLQNEENVQNQNQPDFILDDDNMMDCNLGEKLIEDEEEEEENSNISKSVTHVETDCFPCPQCDRSFPLKQLLDLHLPIHTREKPYECGECNKKFFTKYDLTKHMNTHSNEKPHHCVACNKAFSREALLHRHEKVHVDIPKYQCPFCEKSFINKNFLENHLEKHRKRKPYTCNICQKSFVFKQGLDRHAQVHSQNKPHKCNYCEASFTSAIKLTRHITSHAGLRPYPCKLCGRTFLLSHHLTRHMRSHYAVQNFTPEVIINQHKCDICSMSFRRKDSLINHSAIHSMVNLRCVICNTSFQTAQLVKEHITTHLTGLPFPCEKCDYSFETSEQLEEHELKHAEMEYEEQIEQEVISEAMHHGKKQSNIPEDEISLDQDELEEGEVSVAEFTISDLSNPEVIPRFSRNQENMLRQKKSQISIASDDNGNSGQLEEHNEEVMSAENEYSGFLKDEIGSDQEGDSEQQQHDSDLEETEPPMEPIKPIIRQEGTKVYQRRVPIERKIPETVQEPSVRLSSLQHSTDQQKKDPPQVINTLNTQLLNTKKPVNMKMGDKTVKVQKFIVTKEEMKAMAKQGILEIKNGQVVLKKQGLPVLNATLKPVQKNEIDSLLDKKENKLQIKRYPQKRILEKHLQRESTSFSRQLSESIIDLDDTSTDVSQTTLQGIQ